MKRILLVTGLLVTLIAAPAVSTAAMYPSDGRVQFVPNNDQTPPVDPTDPQEPVNPETPGGQPPEAGQAGPLSIDFASSFSFGVNRISNKDQIYYADAQTYRDTAHLTPNYVQVTDNRGTASGWVLTVKQLQQFQADNAALEGAFVSFGNPHVNSNSTDSLAPAVLAVKALLPNSSETQVMTADKTEGAGTWEDYWGEVTDLAQEKPDGHFYTRKVTKAIQLHVPGKTVKLPKTYRTTFVWSLKEIPSN